MAAFTVALVGLDGAGKTTIARRLAASAPDRIRHIYMGDNIHSATHALRPPVCGPGARWLVVSLGGPLYKLRKLLGLANRTLEEAYRQSVAMYHVWPRPDRGLRPSLLD